MSNPFISIDEAIAQAYVSAPSDQIVLNALEINHRAFTEPGRIIRWPVTNEQPDEFICKHESTAPFDADRLVKYLGVPFEITLPSSGANAPGEFSFRIDNIGSYLDEDLAAAAMQGGKITAVFRQYIKGSEAQGPRAIWKGISIKKPKCEGNSIVATGAILEWLTKAYGREYTPEAYPALVRGR